MRVGMHAQNFSREATASVHEPSTLWGTRGRLVQGTRADLWFFREGNKRWHVPRTGPCLPSWLIIGWLAAVSCPDPSRRDPSESAPPGDGARASRARARLLPNGTAQVASCGLVEHSRVVPCCWAAAPPPGSAIRRGWCRLARRRRPGLRGREPCAAPALAARISSVSGRLTGVTRTTRPAYRRVKFNHGD
jgi:hypothetical protein